jgi:hypothetical protein
LPLIKWPVPVVHGCTDGVHPVAEARRIAKGFADTELWIMETANSLPVAGHPLWKDQKAGLREFLLRDDDV